jgi:hypothetical protein
MIFIVVVSCINILHEFFQIKRQYYAYILLLIYSVLTVIFKFYKL